MEKHQVVKNNESDCATPEVDDQNAWKNVNTLWNWMCFSRSFPTTRKNREKRGKERFWSARYVKSNSGKPKYMRTIKIAHKVSKLDKHCPALILD